MSSGTESSSYIGKALLVANRYSRILPVMPERICSIEGIRLLPLSGYVSNGISEKEVFSMWRNSDGALNVYFRGRERLAAISYNDRCAPHRIRFTLAEELMHYFLGHADDPRSCYGRKEYSGEFYARCETEAKHAACILLCPPVFFYNYRPNTAEMMKICSISEDCAASIRRYYTQDERLITKSFEYARSTLPELSFDPRHKTVMFDDGYEL